MKPKDNFMLVKNQRIESNQRLSAKAKRRLILADLHRFRLGSSLRLRLRLWLCLRLCCRLCLRLCLRCRVASLELYPVDCISCCSRCLKLYCMLSCCNVYRLALECLEGCKYRCYSEKPPSCRFSTSPDSCRIDIFTDRTVLKSRHFRKQRWRMAFHLC